MSIKKLISHRGNLNGPNQDLENSPNYIELSISKGFDCEVDLWKVKDELFLGHDKPQYKIDFDFIKSFQDFLWVHCKNFDAIDYLVDIDEGINYFWHENDKFTLTSKGFIWTYPDNIYALNSVIVNLGKNNNEIKNCHGVCSDFILTYR